MYRILIVDDEKTERECIRFLIEDAKLPLEMMEAEDGSGALDVMEHWRPDILFTDVQMPVMDGLDLIRKAQKRYPTLKPVIFSGYADFEYARTAITLGVENYILKPVVPEDLCSTLITLLQQLDEEESSREQQDKQHTFLLQYALHLAVSGNAEALQSDPSILSQLSAFRTMVLLDFPGTFLENHYSSFYDTLRNGSFPDMEFLNPSPNQALLLFQTSYDNPEFLGRKLLSLIRQTFQTDCYLSISLPLDHYSSLKEAFAAIEQQMEQRFWSPDERIFVPSAGDPAFTAPESIDDTQQMNLIRLALASGNGDSLQQNLNLLFQKYRLPSNQSQIYVKFIFSNLLTALYPYLPSSAGAAFPSLDEMISQLYLQRDLSEIIQKIQELADPIIAGFSVHGSDVRKEIVTVEAYIHQNYGGDLSVEALSSLVYLTPDYLSRLFKKATGKSLSQYIRQYRMEKARELLLTTQKKIIQIGTDVGYPNYPYFCQSFREYFGSSPEKYRQEKTL